ncbi:MAG: Rieske 2Fe-2S domain-containing protein [Proteobacteria bacterium]|nr:Rieske 2Fe-2S domain-containing protein [Pseudomonadota bacterium]
MRTTLYDIVDPQSIAQVRKPIAEARTLPREAFTDPDFYCLEQERIYQRHWVACCFTSDVAGEGDAWPFKIMGMPMLAVRAKDGQLRTFHNITPYDGCPLRMEAARGLTRLVGPYHGWEYGLDGRLLSAPYWDGVEDCPRARVAHLDTQLAELPCREFLGVVFVHVGRNPVDFDEYVAPVRRHFVDYDFDVTEFLRGAGGEPLGVLNVCRCNWKTFFENSAINVLHENFVHAAYRQSPQIPRIDAAGRKTFHEIMDGDLLGLGFSAARFAATYPALGIPHLGRRGQRPDAATFATLYPNFYVSILPDFIEVAIAMPDGVASTCERKQFRVHRSVATDVDLLRAAESMCAEFETAAREDGVICEAVQAARQSPAFSQRFYSPFWDVMHHSFSIRVLDDLEVDT